MAEQQTETWDLWYPKAGATGISFGRGRVASGVDIMLVHAAPETLTVTVHNKVGQIVATGKELSMTIESPMSRLTRQGNHIKREDIWPSTIDLEQLVILPGGEVGTLKQWWHADEGDRAGRNGCANLSNFIVNSHC